MGKRLTTEEFINKAILIHGVKYNYSLVDYIDTRSKIVIICNEHGEFMQKPNDHLNGCGCNSCGLKTIKDKFKSNNSNFISKAKEIHGDKYDYSKVNYVNAHVKVKIICPEHGEFEQKPNNHLNGKGCSRCVGKCRSLTTNMVIDDFNKIHNNKYDYSMVNYIDNTTKISIICPIHGVFEQTPAAHKQKQGCPLCNISKGEDSIKLFLEKNNIIFERQKRFKECRNIRPLPFDFYLPEHNICIEYNGKQHYKPINYWGGEDGFNLRQIRDKIKMEYCHKNNITLITIKYDDSDLVLESKLNRVAIIR